MKRYLSLWLPHWPIERLKRCTTSSGPGCEQGSKPGSEPFALIITGTKGIQLSALNARALSEGLAPGMRLADARAIMPSLITRPAETDKDRDALTRLAHWSTRWGPYVNSDGEDGLWIDVTGVAHLFGGERAMLHNIVTRYHGLGLTARPGLADTYAAAWALARYTPAKKLHNRIAPKGGTKEALARLPLDALRLAPDIIQLLKRLGLYRIADIYDLPRSSLRTRFRSKDHARALLLRLDQALGSMKEPKTPLTEPPLHQARRAYPDPLISSQGVETAIAELANELARDLQKLCLGAREVRLAVYRTDASTFRLSVNMTTPCNTPDHIIRMFHEKLSRFDAGFGIDLIILGAFNCDKINHTQSRFDAGKEKARQAELGRLLDRLDNRLGPGTTYRLRPETSHIPERAQSRQNAALSKTSPGPAAWPDTTPPRPALLFRQPELITVMAEIPEGPPAQFTWRRVIHRISRAEGPERIEPEWWREIGGKETRTRDYYRVEDTSGSRFWLFRDGLYTDDTTTKEPLWYMHGLFG